MTAHDRAGILHAGIFLGALAAAAVAVAAGAADRPVPPPGAGYVGSEACAECHAEVAGFYRGTPHALGRQAAVPGNGSGLCEACHGPGSLHVEAGGDGPIIGVAALGALSPDARADLCFQCHSSLKRSWEENPHAGSTASCADCHADQAHFTKGTRPASAFRIAGEFCLQCHPGQLADFRLQYHHPVLEGEIGCVDCHAPHGEPGGGSALNDEARPCLRCHAEVAGPFVFEHEAVVTEPCTVCHRPHGSPNDRLLITDSNSLCLRCHHEPGYPVIGRTDHTEFLGRRARCYDCHVEVHGSNVDETYRKP